MASKKPDNWNCSIANLVKEIGQPLVRILRRRLPADEVDDVVQDTYLHLLKLQDPSSIRNLSGFAYRTAYNLAIDRIRYLKIRSVPEEADPDSLASAHPSPEDIADGSFALESFRKTLNELPVVVRHAFLLKWVMGMTHTEIAKHLGIHQRTAERYIVRAFEHCYRHRSRFGR